MSDDTAAAGIIAQAIARLTTITSANSGGGGGGVSTIGPTTPTTLTPGSVVFAGASTLAQDNANFFWDSTNHVLSTTGLTVTAAPTFSALTAGSVPFAGTAGLLSQNNANLNWNGNTFTIKGAGGVSRLNLWGTSAGYVGASWVDLLRTTIGGVALESSTGGTMAVGSLPWSHVVGAATNDPVHFITNDIVRITILPSGNVGIGTAAPSTTLQVQGSPS